MLIRYCIEDSALQQLRRWAVLSLGNRKLDVPPFHRELHPLDRCSRVSRFDVRQAFPHELRVRKSQIRENGTESVQIVAQSVFIQPLPHASLVGLANIEDVACIGVPGDMYPWPAWADLCTYDVQGKPCSPRGQCVESIAAVLHAAKLPLSPFI
ncbi:hypothetical protein ACETU7_07770 [Rhodococcus sp. 3Y1]